MQGRILTEHDVIKLAATTSDTGQLYYKIFSKGAITVPYATLENNEQPHSGIETKTLAMKQKDLLRFYAKVWVAMVKFLKSQASKHKPVNSVYFGKFLPKSTPSCPMAYSFIPAPKFLDDNSLIYSDTDEFNLNPYTSEIPDKMPMVSSSSIAAVCFTSKQIIRFVLSQLVGAIPRLLNSVNNAKLRLNLGLGELVIKNNLLHFQNKKKETEQQQNAQASPPQVPSLPATYRDIVIRKDLTPSRAVSAKIDEYKTMMHENTHSHFSKVSVNTPLTKNTQLTRQQKLAKRNKLLYSQLANRAPSFNRQNNKDQSKKLNPITQEYHPIPIVPKRHESLKPISPYCTTPDRSLPHIDRKRYSSSQLQRTPNKGSNTAMNHAESTPGKLLSDEHVASTMEQAYQRYEDTISKNKKEREQEKKDFKRHIKHNEKFINNMRLMRLKQLKENESYIKLQRTLNQQKKQKEIKEKMLQERTHFGPEETDVSTHDIKELTHRKKNQFKSDLLLQIAENKQKANEEKQSNLDYDKDFTNNALESMRSDLKYLEDRKKTQYSQLQQAWRKQQELKVQEKEANYCFKL